MTPNFQILTSNDSAALTATIKSLLNQGWQLTGNVSLAIDNVGTKWYSQSLVFATVTAPAR